MSSPRSSAHSCKNTRASSLTSRAGTAGTSCPSGARKNKSPSAARSTDQPPSWTRCGGASTAKKGCPSWFRPRATSAGCGGRAGIGCGCSRGRRNRGRAAGGRGELRWEWCGCGGRGAPHPARFARRPLPAARGEVILRPRGRSRRPRAGAVGWPWVFAYPGLPQIDRGGRDRSHQNDRRISATCVDPNPHFSGSPWRRFSRSLPPEKHWAA